MRLSVVLLLFLINTAVGAPFGEHNPFKGRPCEALDVLPEPKEFFQRFVLPGRAVLLRGALAQGSPEALKNWKSDTYLAERFGNETFDVEVGKKENRDDPLKRLTMSEFLQKYESEDIYLVDDLSMAMRREINLLSVLSQGGASKHLGEAVLWFSGGGTQSRIHNDNYEGINCLLDGQKTFHLMDFNTTQSSVRRFDNGWRIDRSSSIVDVTNVDLEKFPGYATAPHFDCQMNAGDCIYVPSEMFHQVSSPKDQRNMAVNVWWSPIKTFDEETRVADLSFAALTFKTEDDDDDDDGTDLPSAYGAPDHEEL